jgi:hypothetical protein
MTAGEATGFWASLARAALTAGAAAALAWWAGPAFAAANAPPEPVEVVVAAPGPDDRNPAAKSNEVWLRKVVADGRVLRPADLTRTGNWEQEGGWPSPFLVHRNDVAPASLSFQARTAAIEFVRSEWSGIATLRAGDHAARIDLYAPSGPTVWVDLPQPPSPWWLAVIPWAVAALAWAAARPWRDDRAAARFLVATLFAAHAVAAAMLPVDTTDDSVEYLPCFVQNFDHGQPAYFPPGYGLFLAVCDAVPAATIGGVAAVAQHLLAAASICALRPLVAAAAGAWVGMLWLALATWLAPALLMPRLVMSETLAFATMAGALAAAHAAVASGRPGRFARAGVALGLGVVTRVVPLAGAGPAIALLALGLPGLRQRAAAVGVALGVAVAIAAVPVGWFAAHGHGVALSSAVGRHLYNRVVHEQKLVAPSGPATDRVRAALPNVDLPTLPHWDLYWALYATAAKDDAESLIGAVAFEALRAHPAAYLAFTVPHTWRNLSADASDYLLQGAGTQKWQPAYEAASLLGTTGDAMARGRMLARASAAVWPWVCWACLASLLAAAFTRAPRVSLALAVVPLGYLFATSLVEYHLPRYQFAVAPFVLAAAMTPLGALRRRRGANGPAA